MADPENDPEKNDDPENTGEGTEFLAGDLGAGSELDELHFDDDELVDLDDAEQGSIDQILTKPLDPLVLLDTPPHPASPADPNEDFLLDEPSQDPDEIGSPPALPPAGSAIPSSGSILDKALSGATGFPPGSDPQDAQVDPISPEPPSEEPAGNQRLDPSRRRPRPRPRPRQRSAPAEDEIIFDDDDEFAATPPEEIAPAVEIPPDKSDLAKAPEPEPPLEPEPVTAPELEPPLEPEPEPEAPADSAPIPEIPPVGLGEIDDDFPHLPEVPEPVPTPTPPIGEPPLSIDPNPIPDVEAIARRPDPPDDSADAELDAFIPVPPPPADATAAAPSPDAGEPLADDELTIDDIPSPRPPDKGVESAIGAGRSWFGQLKPLELASLIVIALGCLGGVFLFNSWSKSGLPPRSVPAKPAETAPSSLDGQIVQISKLEAYWRSKDESDSSKVMSEFLPELSLTLDGGTKGYLLAIFRNAEGELVDTADLKIEAGKFVSTGNDTATLTSTIGLENEFVLATYRAEDKWRWNVTLRESADKEEWTDIARFYFPADRR